MINNQDTNNPLSLCLYDIEHLITLCKAKSILLVGDIKTDFLQNYLSQNALIQQECELVHIHTNSINRVDTLSKKFDIGVVVNCLEHISKQKGAQLLAKLRDQLTQQYCLCITSESHWNQNDFFAFGLSRLSHYKEKQTHYDIYKYAIHSYKLTPKWLNSDNWANPNLWDKYRW